MKRIIIIGGGITGLAAAHRLVELAKENALEFEVTLLEASSRLGGTIQTERRDGFLLERGPDSFISEKPEALDLVKRLGLESQLIETNTEHRRSLIVRNGRLRPVPEGFQLLGPSRLWPFVTSDIFSWTGKARMALDLLLPRGNTNQDVDESLAQFVRRRFGRAVRQCPTRQCGQHETSMPVMRSRICAASSQAWGLASPACPARHAPAPAVLAWRWCQQAVVADALETRWQHMQQEAIDEAVRRQAQRAHAIAMRRVADAQPTESSSMPTMRSLEIATRCV